MASQYIDLGDDYLSKIAKITGIRGMKFVGRLPVDDNACFGEPMEYEGWFNKGSCRMVAILQDGGRTLELNQVGKRGYTWPHKRIREALGLEPVRTRISSSKKSHGSGPPMTVVKQPDSKPL